MRGRLELALVAALWCPAVVTAQAQTAQLHAVDGALAEGRREEAVTFLEAMAREGTLSDARGWLLLGVARREASDLDGALAAFAHGRRMAPDDVDLALERALTLAWARRLADSERAYARVVDRAPGRGVAIVGLARVLVWRGRGDEALARLEPWLRAHPHDADAWSVAGDAHRSRGRAEAAATRYRAALGEVPAHPDALRGVAAARAMSRWTLRFEGSAAWTGGELGGAGGASASVDVDPEVRLNAGYAAELPGSLGGTAPDATTRHAAWLGVSVAPLEGLRLEATYRASVEPQNVTHALELGGSGRLGPVVLLAGARPAIDHQAAPSLLLRAGVQLVVDDVWALAQIHRFDGPGTSATTGTLTLSGRAGVLEVRVTGGVGELAGSLTWNLGARVALEVDPRFTVAVRWQSVLGPVERHGPSVEASWRF